MTPLFALLEHVAQNARPIRHDAVNAHLQEVVHLGSVVHGPHMNLHMRIVCPFEKPGGEHRYALVPQWDLQTPVVGTSTGTLDPAPARAELTESGLGHGANGFAGTSRSAHRRTQAIPDPLESRLGESPDAHPVDGVEAHQHIDEWIDHRIGFRIDVEPLLRESNQQFLERRNGFTAPQSGTRYLPPAQRRDLPSSVRDPVEAFVMCRHNHSIGGQVHVGLEICETHLDRSSEGSEAVLGRFLGTSTVRESQRRIVDQEPV